MDLTQFIRQLAQADVAEQAIDALPYAHFLGLRASVTTDQLLIHMPYKLDLVGQPQPQRLHGGVIAGMLETCGALAVARVLAQQTDMATAIPLPKPINITLDYLRAGAPEDTFARAYITRMGRRIANVRTEAWQGDASRLITTAHMNVLVAS